MWIGLDFSLKPGVVMLSLRGSFIQETFYVKKSWESVKTKGDAAYLALRCDLLMLTLRSII